MRASRYIAILLVVAAVCSCSQKPTVARATLLASLQFHEESVKATPVSFLDEFLSHRSFSRDGELFDDRHILRGISYKRSHQMLVIVSVIRTSDSLSITINGFLYADALPEFQVLFNDLKSELALRFPQKDLHTEFQIDNPNEKEADSQ